MTAAERRRFMAALLLETTRQLPRMLLARAGVWSSGPDPSRITCPDTPFATRVIEATAHLEPMPLQHCLRSYLFARALAAAEQVHLDDEAVFAACLLHDLAFPSTEEPCADRCFALRGAELAEAVLEDSPLSAAQRHAVLDAITLHLNPHVTSDRGELQRLVHDGILADVMGVRAWEMDRAGFERVSEMHPRHAWNHRGPVGFCAHASRFPQSRAAAAVRCGFALSVRMSPGYALEVSTLDRDALHRA